MTPQQYNHIVELLRKKYDLPKTTQYPTSEGQINLMEKELGRRLPQQYKRFMLEIGSGAEFLGQATWYGFDYGSPSNLISINEYLQRKMNTLLRNRKTKLYPKTFLAILDTHNNNLYGLMPNQNTREYEPTIYNWSLKTGELTKTAANLNQFLDYRIKTLKTEIDNKQK